MLVKNDRDMARLLLKYYLLDLRDTSKDKMVERARESFWDTIIVAHKNDLATFYEGLLKHWPTAKLPNTHDEILDFLLGREKVYRSAIGDLKMDHRPEKDFTV